MKKILVATGTSQNKLKFAVDYIKDYLSKNLIEAVVTGESIYEVKIDEVKPDVIVAIGPHSFDGSISVISGMAFITKMGMDDACKDIANALM